jgi:hypothetical protein
MAFTEVRNTLSINQQVQAKLAASLESTQAAISRIEASQAAVAKKVADTTEALQQSNTRLRGQVRLGFNVR